jgi:catechol 2,3-dioxygenase-like lactoylglutathione lyase family enzyme
MTVSDMQQAMDFYGRVLGFRKISDQVIGSQEHGRLHGVPGRTARVVRMALGEEVIELTAYEGPPGRPIPPDSRSNDLWFQHLAIVVSDISRAYAHLRSLQVQHVSNAPQILPQSIPAAAGIKAFYFRDPDGHNLELIEFPPDKGDPKWQRNNGALFLGIDHTAIAVSGTERSLTFYRNLLGLKVVGSSENVGGEQEHLNGVFGSRVWITALHSPAGPGIEFLHYLAPPGGRPLPDEERATDLFHWQTTLEVDDLVGLAGPLRERGVRFISPGIVTLHDAGLGFRRAILIRDPDGHALRIVERPREAAARLSMARRWWW